MFNVEGKYTKATIFTDLVEEQALSQIINICNQEFAQGMKIKIMPDCHAGAGCCIGTTMTLTDTVVPNLVGVDINCGMYLQYIDIAPNDVDYKHLDELIHAQIPSGFEVRDTLHPLVEVYDLENKLNTLKCIKAINVSRALHSISSLGGGNHFIELNKSSKNQVCLVVHTGSRNLGKQIAEYYQKLAYTNLTRHSELAKKECDQRIKELKAQGRQADIQREVKLINEKHSFKGDLNLAYLEGQNFKDYLHDMEIAQLYARVNRLAIVETIMKGMDWRELSVDGVTSFETVHNYIDLDNMILRKGAISAQKDELVLIPINMRDGSILAKGKGNPEWNYSAPHGAGRLMSRSQAKQQVSLDDYKETMGNIYTTSVCESTIDESPMAYKPIESILNNIQDTVEILDIIKPIYNFKAH